MSTATLTQPDPTIGDDELYEVIDGHRVRIPPMAALSVWLAFELARHLSNATSASIGRAVTEMLFHLPAPVNRDRRPDLAFVSYQKWAKHRAIPYSGGAWDVVPDLAGEVVSPNDNADEIQDKVADYFRAGVGRVWVVYPAHQQVHVYHSQTQITVLTKADALDGGAAAPGFRLPLADLFTDPAPAGANGESRLKN
ncbi:MAG: Uma2 family endonuclease [Planctomycetes bacterium]|nr:Uma2 family endonuclease [Planctomycetota bacterium]